MALNWARLFNLLWLLSQKLKSRKNLNEMVRWILMSVKALKCPSCGAPLESIDLKRCEYCGAVLVYSVPQQVFVTEGKEGTFRGIARNVQQRQENGYTVLTFRVEQIDNVGNVLGYTQVELREPRIRGTLVDGDEVKVVGKIDKEGILSPKQILNLRTGAHITKSRSNIWFVLFLLPFIFGVVGFVVARAIEGAIMGFLGGCFVTVFLFIILAAVKR